MNVRFRRGDIIAKLNKIENWRPNRKNPEKVSFVKYEDAIIKVKIGNRKIEGIQENTFEILEIERESRKFNRYQNYEIKSTGFMDRMMKNIEKYVETIEFADIVYIEAIYNEFLSPWFERRGYIRDLKYSWPYNYYAIV